MEKVDNLSIERGEIFVTTLMGNKLIKINRDEFLMSQFSDHPEKQSILENGPISIISEEEIKKIANKLLNDTALKTTSASFLAGLPGGFAMAAAIPADILQFYGMSTRLAQQLMYLYGYPDMYNDEKLSEKGKEHLILFLGVMLGVSGASKAVTVISARLAQQTMKKLPQKALTKTLYYPIIKKVLGALGVKVTKNSFAKSVSKVIPVVGGVISGGMTLASILPMGRRLQGTLHEGTYIITDSSAVKIKNHSEDNFDDFYDDFFVNDEPEHIVDVVEEEQITEDPFEKLKQIKELFDLGVMNEDEYNEIKQKYISML